MMKVRIKQIPFEGIKYQGEEPASILELDGNAQVCLEGDVHYSLFFQVVSQELVVRGTIEVSVKLQCARCAEFFSTTISNSAFLRVCPISEEIDFVDITEDIREDLLLHLPRFPLCSEDCKGLCEQCGINKNNQSCSCEQIDQSDSWSVLNQLNL